MATHQGQEGAIYIGANPVAELVEYEYEIAVEPLVEPALADAWDPADAGAKRWSGRASFKFDDANAEQALIVEGAKVTLIFYDIGLAPGTDYREGSALITRVARRLQRNQMQVREFEFLGDGELLEQTVPTGP